MLTKLQLIQSRVPVPSILLAQVPLRRPGVPPQLARAASTPHCFISSTAVPSGLSQSSDAFISAAGGPCSIAGP